MIATHEMALRRTVSINTANSFTADRADPRITSGAATRPQDLRRTSPRLRMTRASQTGPDAVLVVNRSTTAVAQMNGRGATGQNCAREGPQVTIELPLAHAGLIKLAWAVGRTERGTR